ncbi:F-box/kelch-repeat protein At3g23880-like [Coffea arabica]|uniref:F-box/kelch-repeat protein At3g23880-like n=1 Tax=Coffea arabica TaxID=13443 RepID=A0A6P6X4X3_COFAR|nr:F-box/kelch-repeat protein At3g23880-like [Coffea arabica]
METKAVSDKLPVELIFEILTRLPVKSLVRFMCVSKYWHSLISSREFIKCHLQKSSQTSDTAHQRLIFSTSMYIVFNPELKECDLNSALYLPLTEATNMEYPTYESIPHPTNCCPSPTNSEDFQQNFEMYEAKAVKVLGSCNGLVCIATPERDLFLWNPSIGKYKKLPDSGLEFEYSDSKSVYNCVPAYGFGYDELHDDYKVVAILGHCLALDPDEEVVKVYSQRTNSWKRIEDSKNCLPLKDWCVNNIIGGTLLNGKLHWTATFGSHYHRSEKKIISFDLASETFGEVELPENMGQPIYPEDPFYRWTIGGLRGGCLILLCDHNQEKTDLDVWIMMEYGVRQSWKKVVSVRYAEYREYMCKFDILVQPVFSSKKGEILLKLGSKLVLYNPQDNSWRELHISNMPDESGFLKVDIYDESLVLLDANDG